MLVKQKFNHICYVCLAILITCFLCTHSPNLEYDTPSYIHFDSTRPPLYPIFIWLFSLIRPYQFFLVMWMQAVITFFALLYARSWLIKNLKVFDFSVFLVCLFTIVTVSFHYQIGYIQSEGLAFPLFIVTFFLLVECFYQFNLKKIFYLALLVGLLVLTRLQFYYFYGIFVLLFAWYSLKRVPYRKLSMSALILFGSILLTTVLDHGYHYFKHGTFSGASYGGLLILSQTLYLADDHAASYFQDPTDRTNVQKMITWRNAQALNRDAALVLTLKPSRLQYAYQAYSRNYSLLQDVIVNAFKLNSKNKAETPSIFDMNESAARLNKILLLNEPKRNFIFLVWKFVQCVGGISLFLFYSVLFFATSSRMIKYKHANDSISSIFVVCMTMVTFLNAAIIALCNPDLPTYFCYSQFLLYCLAAYTVNKKL